MLAQAKEKARALKREEERNQAVVTALARLRAEREQHRAGLLTLTHRCEAAAQQAGVAAEAAPSRRVYSFWMTLLYIHP
jgi:uncharacterized protein (DUF342 family)